MHMHQLAREQMQSALLWAPVEVRCCALCIVLPQNSEYDAKTGRRGTGGVAAGAGDDGGAGGGALAAFQARMKAKMGLAAAVKLPE